jgi:hypothetical protein
MNIKSSFPRVLVISNNAFSFSLNNGKTLSNLFKDWPRKMIAQLFFHPNDSPEWGICDNYYKISDIDILKSILKLSNHCGGICEHSIIPEQRILKVGRLRKRINSLDMQKSVMILLRDFLWRSGRWKTKQLCEWLSMFNPEIIFFVGGYSGFAHEIACWTSTFCKAPMSVFFTDDYVLNPMRESIFDPYLQKKNLKHYKKTIAESTLHFTIGDIMAKDYQSQFGVIFYPIMNCVEFDKHYPVEVENQQIIISYFGGLHLNRWKMLIEIGELLNQLSKELSIKMQLNIFTTSYVSDSKMKLLCTPPLSFHNGVYGEALFQQMTEANILLHVESMDNRSRVKTHYSVSTKLPEYFSAGRCVVGYGPSEVASIRLLADNSIGITITDKDSIVKRKEKLKNIIINKVSRMEIAQNAFDFAKKKFDERIVRDRIKILLSNAAKTK